jgi:hypothetical protein
MLKALRYLQELHLIFSISLLSITNSLESTFSFLIPTFTFLAIGLLIAYFSIQFS